MECTDTRRFPRWSNDDAVQRGLESFAGELLRLGRAPSTVDTYLVHVARGWADPLRYLASLRHWQAVRHAKWALCLYADYRGQGQWRQAILAAPEPLRPSRRPVHVPSVVVWRALGPDLLRRHPAELGHVLWILLYSGLRIGDVCTLTRAQVAQAATGETVEMRQKGRSGRRKRTFRPLDEVRPKLAWLAGRPGWAELWQAVASVGGKGSARDPKSASEILRRYIPDPYDPHDFRRAFATYLYYQGRDLLTIAQMGGWESAASVERYIVIVPEERIDQARRGLSNLLFPRTNQPTIPTRPPVGPNR